ncbi:diaminobutyrate--2-oxoglutarate transaminase [Ferruginivarius sediminum]|uniref:L-2,4-diaminobutyric acid acetyltransferase n=1 Tax=Ferruginivarius sediminum TaxID=2661937 RepID=A0A369TBP6_9PROT|nr:diaminobutyrate--2-oxoglutarate transaminase [Ferruginivarius sediminum]RDD61944.1 diaminobutyrate--2-oxoglutarate transaminase [Ferruginivarius sediminum]
MTAQQPNPSDIVYRQPTIDDGETIWRLVRATGTLAENSPYSYLMFCRSFADTCIVADAGDRLAGAVLAYTPPQTPDVLFVWQIGVHPAFRGRKLGFNMLDQLLDRPACAWISRVEATVTPSNDASMGLFHKLAEYLNAPMEQKVAFPEAAFPEGEAHETEMLLRIGPIGARKQPEPSDMGLFERLESEVRAYSRDFPTVFTRASGALMWDEQGRRYIDFFAGAGVLNYGHNHPQMRQRLMEYMAGDGMLHGLDMATTAKARLLQTLEEVILSPRGLDYKVQFPGPTGTNAVEAALKLARKVTGRHNVVAFTAGFHGMTLGALAATGNRFKRHGAGLPLAGTVHLPFDGYLGGTWDSADLLDRVLADPGSGIDHPAAVIVETVQGEGGINVASFDWLKRVAEICRANDVLLIVDDIQMGCGRTGPFFSFEPAGIVPDIVCLSKSIGGIGLPLALTLFRRELDVWEPAEHNATFRGNNAAFVTAAEALDIFWRDDAFSAAVARKGALVAERLAGIVERFPELKLCAHGRGLVHGLECGLDGVAKQIVHQAFERGLIAETSGARSQVVKVMPPLVIDDETLSAGLDLLEHAVAALAMEPGEASGTSAS